MYEENVVNTLKKYLWKMEIGLNENFQNSPH